MLRRRCCCWALAAVDRYLILLADLSGLSIHRLTVQIGTCTPHLRSLVEHGVQQQSRRTPRLRSNDGTDRQTDGRSTVSLTQLRMRVVSKRQNMKSGINPACSRQFGTNSTMLNKLYNTHYTSYVDYRLLIFRSESKILPPKFLWQYSPTTESFRISTQNCKMSFNYF